MNVHAERTNVRAGDLQKIRPTESGRFDMQNAAQYAKQFSSCPVCGKPLPRVYRTSVRSITLQCSKCLLRWTMTWSAIARTFEKEIKPHLSVDAGNVTGAVFQRLAAIERRGKAAS